VEILYGEYQYAAAFAAASVLAMLAIVTLVLKTMAEHRIEGEARNARGTPID
jgi:sulfate transport system permease protein